MIYVYECVCGQAKLKRLAHMAGHKTYLPDTDTLLTLTLTLSATTAQLQLPVCRVNDTLSVFMSCGTGGGAAVQWCDGANEDVL